MTHSGYARNNSMVQGAFFMKNRVKADAYTELFLYFSERVEFWLKRGVIAVAVLLLLLQAALQFPAIRHLLASADRHEGVPIYHTDKH